MSQAPFRLWSSWNPLLGSILLLNNDAGIFLRRGPVIFAGGRDHTQRYRTTRWKGLARVAVTGWNGVKRCETLKLSLRWDPLASWLLPPSAQTMTSCSASRQRRGGRRFSGRTIGRANKLHCFQNLYRTCSQFVTETEWHCTGMHESRSSTETNYYTYIYIYIHTV